MPGQAIAEGLFFFMAYAFFGWIAECCCKGLTEGLWINRGFLYGPFIPLYGFGGLFLIYLPPRIGGSLILLFLAAFFLLSALEYIVSRFLEKLFQIRNRDCSRQETGFPGRICLRNFLYRGLSGLLVMKAVQPGLAGLAEGIGFLRLTAAGAVFLGCAVFDTAAAFRRAENFAAALRETEIPGEKLLRELGKIRAVYGEKYLRYEDGKDIRRREWRRSIDEANARLRRARTAGTAGTAGTAKAAGIAGAAEVAAAEAALQKEVERANGELRLALMSLKEELTEAAVEKDAAVRALWDSFRRDIRLLFHEKLEPPRQKSLRQIARLFPASMSGPGDDDAGDIWREIREAVREMTGKAVNG